MTTYAFPSTIVPSESTIELVSNTRTFESPITGAIQTIDRGGERWVIQMRFANLKTANRGVFMAWLARLNGQQHRFTLHNHAENNRGILSGTPLVAGASQTGTSLNIDGCSIASPLVAVTNWIRAGDFFSVNGELKLCVADANSDATSAATISFVPRLRAAPANNAPLTIASGLGTFLLGGSSSWTNKPGGFSDFTITAIEDIAS